VGLPNLSRAIDRHYAVTLLATNPGECCAKTNFTEPDSDKGTKPHGNEASPRFWRRKIERQCPTHPTHRGHCIFPGSIVSHPLLRSVLVLAAE
jgi:hypothetical protein